MRRWPIVLLLALAACNRSGVADVTLDADAAQRNATAAKTASDLAAALAASRGPAPIVHDVPPEPRPTAAREKASPTQRTALPEEDIGGVRDAGEALSNE